MNTLNHTVKVHGKYGTYKIMMECLSFKLDGRANDEMEAMIKSVKKYIERVDKIIYIDSVIGGDRDVPETR